MNPHRQATYLIRAAAWLVPSSSRDQWLREWLAELHYALRAIADRDGRSSELIAFARGAFRDAAWHRMDHWNAESTQRALARTRRSPGFCLAALAALVLAITICSGFLPETRAVLFPLPYNDAGRVATVAQGAATLAVRSGVRREWVEWWRADSHAIEDAATYSWSEQVVDQSLTLRATVSKNFFDLFGARSTEGRIGCDHCVLLSYDFWRKNYGSKIPEDILMGNRRYPVAGIVEKQFWFLTRRIGVWEIAGSGNPATKTGVVLRLRRDVSPKYAESELESILRRHGITAWSSLISISPLPGRVRSVFTSFALALLLAIATVLPATRLTFAWRTPRLMPRAAFFCSKTILALLAVLLAGLEFTRAPAINMLGGTDLATEPLSTWLFLLGSMGAISWSIFDQRRRCRVCLRRFELAAQIGCPGCVLLSWAGTELVCLEGHGTLHVPAMPSCWNDPDQWTSLDDSLVELFARRR